MNSIEAYARLEKLALQNKSPDSPKRKLGKLVPKSFVTRKAYELT